MEPLAYTVLVFPNGQIATCDKNGEQIPELQGQDTPELREAIRKRASLEMEWNEHGK